MSVVIKTSEIQYKDNAGNYHGINTIAEKKIADQEAALDAKIASTQTSINSLESQKNTIAAAIASMAQLGTDTTLSTPGMAADAATCGELKSALTMASQPGPNYYDPTAEYTVKTSAGATSSGYAVQQDKSLKCVVNNSSHGRRYVVNDDIILPAGKYTISGYATFGDFGHTDEAKGIKVGIGLSNYGNAPLTTTRGGTTAVATSSYEGWFQKTFTLEEAEKLAFMAEGRYSYEATGTLPLYITYLQIEAGDQLTDYKEDWITAYDFYSMKKAIENALQITELQKESRSKNGIIYTTNTARHSFTTLTNGGLSLVVGSNLVFRLVDNPESAAWADIGAELISGGLMTVDGNVATVTLNRYSKSLVYNITDKLLHIRDMQSVSNLKQDDIVLFAISYGAPVCGIIYDEYNARRIIDIGVPLTVSEILNKSFNSAVHAGATDFADKCKEFSSLMLGDTVNNITAPSNFESFLFFTDPHLTEYNNWEGRCYEFIAQIQKYYNSTPTTFCLCGGDWLGNSDLPGEACFKLGYIDGFMHSMFDNCYMLVGNHDTNYQGKKDAESATGTTRLSNQSIADLWYRNEKKAYFTFNGANTKFYCFDTGVENQAQYAYDNYGWDQVDWFANALLTDNSPHIAIALHIIYYSNNNIQPLTESILELAQAYNNRTTITKHNHDYNYSSATGKIEFCIAGHKHTDQNVLINSIPCVMTTNVRANESSGATFDLCFADYDNGLLKMIRVGDGDNRTIDLATGELVT